MQFSEDQEAALQAVREWLEAGDKLIFRLFGYAGTGKTTLAKYIAEMANHDVLFAAYTGKAAYVLRQKGCTDAATIHSLIYHSRDKSKVRLVELEEQLVLLIKELKAEFNMTDPVIDDHSKVRRLRKDIKDEINNVDQPHFILNRDSVVKDTGLVIIDECSMVNEQMGGDLLSFGTPILVLGDPAQLPPIKGGGYFTENVKPDVMLTKIHRQAAASPIIKLATQVRLKQPIEVGEYDDGCEVIAYGTKIDEERIMSFDQIIVGKNKTRFYVNRKIRRLRGFEDPYPMVDDRIVCLRNHHELGLLNGAIFHVTGLDGVMDRKVHMSIQPEGDLASLDISAHEHHFLGIQDELKWFEKGHAQEFDYGYALTCHKSQGSQWQNVCVMDESYCFRKNKSRWLYTAITRAAGSVTIIQM